ncbi:MAG: tetratricopeptide repeat protein [Candidatus Magnetoovum sp. WYHC-5]|nr:tetratricopeptide repeat protein [Candidatus Magnetoovum sp. WYHC-5]
MPKPIKKKVVKSTDTGEELKDTYDKLKRYYEEHSKDVQIVGAVIIGVLLLIASFVGYMKYTSKQASLAMYKGIAIYSNMYKKPDSSAPERYTKALEEFKRSYDLKKSSLALFYIANVYYSLKDFTNAQSTLIQLHQTFSGDMEVLPLSYYKLYNIYVELNQPEKAFETLQGLYALNTPIYKDVALMELGYMLRKQGKEADAVAKYKEIVQNYPTSPFKRDAQFSMVPQGASNALLKEIPAAGATNNGNAASNIEDIFEGNAAINSAGAVNE